VGDSVGSVFGFLFFYATECEAMNVKAILFTAAIAVLAMAVVARVAPLSKIVNG
jgi:hypothetical protein